MRSCVDCDGCSTMIASSELVSCINFGTGRDHENVPTMSPASKAALSTKKSRRSEVPKVAADVLNSIPIT